MVPCHLLVLISPLDLNTPVAKKSLIYLHGKSCKNVLCGMLSRISVFENLHEVLYIDLK